MKEFRYFYVFQLFNTGTGTLGHSSSEQETGKEEKTELDIRAQFFADLQKLKVGAFLHLFFLELICFL